VCGDFDLGQIVLIFSTGGYIGTYIRRLCSRGCVLPGGCEVNEVVVLKGAESKRVLQSVIDKKIQALMCYLSRDKWHIAKVLPVRVDESGCAVSVLPAAMTGGNGINQLSEWKPRPVNIHIGQSVGLSLKYEGGKFIFETRVGDFEFSAASAGGIIMLELPEQIEMISRRSYFRVRVPEKLEVTVSIRHRGFRPNNGNDKCQQGRLIDISAGGLQIALPATQRPDFAEGQFVVISFSPLPSEKPIEFSAQLRNILSTADGSCFCYGLQIIGLEASKEGRETLARLAGTTELYHELNRNNDCSRCPQVGLKTRTCIKHFRPDWGCLQDQSQ
jgi:hypothetical protein